MKLDYSKFKNYPPFIIPKTILIMLTIFVIFQYSSMGNAQPIFLGIADAQSSNKILSFQDSTFGIAVQYPASWQREDLDPSTGGIVRFSSELENETDAYAENIEIYYVSLARDTTLDDYTSTLLQSHKTNLEDFTIITSNPASISGVPSHQLVFTASSEGFAYKALNEWSVIGSNALIVIYYAEPGKYETYLPVVTNLIDSIRVQPDVFGKSTSGAIYTIPSLGLEIPLPLGWTDINKGEYHETIFKISPETQNPGNKDRILLFGISGGDRSLSNKFKNTLDIDFNCGNIDSASIVMINGIKALESEINCDDSMVMKKIKFYMVTSQRANIFIGYGASSESLYQKYLVDFDSLIQELRLGNATDLSDLNQYSVLFNKTKDEHRFDINGTKHTMNFISNSKVSNLHLNQDAEKLSFIVEDNNKTDGETFIHISDLMQGPYIASIDGKLIDGVLVINDTTTNQFYIDLSYHPGIHKVEIVGSNLVPEFPGLIPILVCALGLTATFLAKKKELSYR